MILTVRYPHVRDLVSYYANKLSDDLVLSILESGVNSENEAEHLSHFIWKMLDEMARDREEGNIVLGGIDNTSMAPDISYEMDALMEKSGFGPIWEKISDEV
jgi:secreted protein with Ig-like and vWFA domain